MSENENTPTNDDQKVLEQASTQRYPVFRRPQAPVTRSNKVAVERPRIDENTSITIDENVVTNNLRIDQLDPNIVDPDYKYAFGHATDPADMASRSSLGWRKVSFKEVKDKLDERALLIYQVRDNAIWYGEQDVLMRIPIRQYLAMQANRMREHMSALGEAPEQLQRAIEDIAYNTRGITKSNAPRIHVDNPEWQGATETFYVRDSGQ